MKIDLLYRFPTYTLNTLNYSFSFGDALTIGITAKNPNIRVTLSLLFFVNTPQEKTLFHEPPLGMG